VNVHRVGLRAAELADTKRVYESTMNRDHIRRLLSRRAEEMPDSPDAPDAADMDDFGSPEEIITTTVDVRRFVDRKRASMAAHASQIPAESFFLAMPDEAFEEAFGSEWFIRRDAPDIRESWIFDDL
jgi:LmbE family N-acetylglucosaminyl deacetylase